MARAIHGFTGGTASPQFEDQHCLQARPFHERENWNLHATTIENSCARADTRLAEHREGRITPRGNSIHFGAIATRCSKIIVTKLRAEKSSI